MGRNLFSVPIFFIMFRESLEASIIVSILLALVEQLVLRPKEHDASDDESLGVPPTYVEKDAGGDAGSGERVMADSEQKRGDGDEISQVPVANNESTVVDRTLVSSEGVDKAENQPLRDRRLLRKLRIQIFAGAMIGLVIALAIGAAFIAVFYSLSNDIWSKSEDLWEGIFSLIASILIFVMGITMMKMDRAKLKWKIKLSEAFGKQHDGNKAGRSSRYALFILPLITVLREGLEAVVFVAGVSLGQEGSSIPIAAIVGLICGLAIGYIIYKSSSQVHLSVFLIISTCVLFLIGAGLFSKAVWDFQNHQFVQLVGADVSETGDGPGSYDVSGNVWHLNCCNPENKLDATGWSIFGGVLGWTNSATVGSILSYVFYWLAVASTLIYMKWAEGRFSPFGMESKAGRERRERRARSVGAGSGAGGASAAAEVEKEGEKESLGEVSGEISSGKVRKEEEEGGEGSGEVEVLPK